MCDDYDDDSSAVAHTVVAWDLLQNFTAARFPAGRFRPTLSVLHDTRFRSQDGIGEEKKKTRWKGPAKDAVIPFGEGSPFRVKGFSWFRIRYYMHHLE